MIAMVLAYPTFACPNLGGDRQTLADASQTEKNKSERCRRGEKPGKDCPDGGERLPQDKRSPLDKIPPLSPLVA